MYNNRLEGGRASWKEVGQALRFWYRPGVEDIWSNPKRWGANGSTGLGKLQDYVLKSMMFVQLQKGKLKVERNSNGTCAERNKV